MAPACAKRWTTPLQEAGVQLGEEYRYDANGNLTQDKNKGLTGIVYNHLNRPRQIHFGAGGDSVVFRYAASGHLPTRPISTHYTTVRCAIPAT